MSLSFSSAVLGGLRGEDGHPGGSGVLTRGFESGLERKVGEGAVLFEVSSLVATLSNLFIAHDSKLEMKGTESWVPVNWFTTCPICVSLFDHYATILPVIILIVRERPMSYAAPFMNALHTALTSSKPLETTLTLFRHPLYKHAHPSPEHLLPLIVSVGATSDSDAVEELYVGSGDKLGWGMYRWR